MSPIMLEKVKNSTWQQQRQQQQRQQQQQRRQKQQQQETPSARHSCASTRTTVAAASPLSIPIWSSTHDSCNVMYSCVQCWHALHCHSNHSVLECTQ
jgi:transcription initiation factor TFIID subunit TAF12